jgi:hypothetical protein
MIVNVNIKMYKKRENSNVQKEEYKYYIIKYWKTILNMKNCEYKLSMESHISHCIAEYFGSRPKGYSKNTISKYLKLQEYLLNGINIYDLYLKAYNNKDYIYNEKELNFSLFDKLNSNLPTIYNSGQFLPFLNLIR